jgi:hypothetical protein
MKSSNFLVAVEKAFAHQRRLWSSRYAGAKLHLLKFQNFPWLDVLLVSANL